MDIIRWVAVNLWGSITFIGVFAVTNKFVRWLWNKTPLVQQTKYENEMLRRVREVTEVESGILESITSHFQERCMQDIRDCLKNVKMEGKESFAQDVSWHIAHLLETTRSAAYEEHERSLRERAIIINKFTVGNDPRFDGLPQVVLKKPEIFVRDIYQSKINTRFEYEKPLLLLWHILHGVYNLEVTLQDVDHALVISGVPPAELTSLLIHHNTNDARYQQFMAEIEKIIPG